jgi:cellulose synthase/poly-beta-1,6-N-acetylglucosamine synthase-like glycosyltransferase
LRERGYKTLYLNEKLSVGLAPEGINEYATQRARWCLGLVQICGGPSGPFRLGNRLPLSFRISLIETFLCWGAGYLFRVFCMLAPILSPATVFMEGIESPAVIARKSANEFAVSLIGDEAREAMPRRVYSERYGKPIKEVDPRRVLAGILHRFAR